MASPAVKSPPISAQDQAAIDKDASDFIRELEVERIIRAFKLNPYDILDLPVGASEGDVKKQYRKKSLLIHPDKYKHERGIEAFDHLKKAEAMLMNPGKRSDIDNVMTIARHAILKAALPPGTSVATVTDDDERIVGMQPSLDSLVRIKSKEVFVEEELARRRSQKLTYANEGAEAAKKEAEVQAKKRKKEEEAAWEDRRDERVSSWRDFAKKGGSEVGKKKKKKLNVLGA